MASLAAEETPGPRAAQATLAPKERRVTQGLRAPAGWLEKWATKDPRGTAACLDPEDPKEPWGSPGSRDLGETLGIQVPVGTQGHLAPRETRAGPDSAILDHEESLVTKANLAPEVPRAAEETSGSKERAEGRARRVSRRTLDPRGNLASEAREDPQDLRESLGPPETPDSRSVMS